METENINIRQIKDGDEVFYPQTDIHGLVNNGEYAIDDEPTAGSDNLVKSGGVNSEIGKTKVAMDILAANNILFNNTFVDIPNIENNKIINANGSVGNFNGVNVWTLTNDNSNRNNCYIYFYFPSFDERYYLNCALYKDNTFIKGYIIQRYQFISLLYGYTIKICGFGTSVIPKYSYSPGNLNGHIESKFSEEDTKINKASTDIIDLKGSIQYSYYKYNIATETPYAFLPFKSTKDYFKVVSSGIVTFNTNADGSVIVYYDSNKNYLGFTNHESGTITKDVIAQYNNAAYVRFSLRNSNYSALTDEQYNSYYVKVISGANPELYSAEKVNEVTETGFKNATAQLDVIKKLVDITAVNNIVLKNASDVTDVEQNKILSVNGTVIDFNGFNVYTITNTNDNFNVIFVKAYFASVATNIFSICNVYDSDGNFKKQLDIQGYQILAIPKGYMLKISAASSQPAPQKSEQYDAVDVRIANLENMAFVQGKNIFAGKKILFLGTSIPAGSNSQVTVDGYSGVNKYPQMLGYLLGATIYNEAVGSSLVRAINPLTGSYKGMPFDACLKSLSQTVAEKQSILDHWQSGLDADCNIVEGGTYGWRDFLAGQGAHGEEYTPEGVPLDYSTWQTAENILKWSYEKKIIAKYFDETSEDFVSHVDYVFIEHAHNDLAGNGYIFRDSPQDRVGYYDLNAEDAYTFTDNKTDRSRFPSTINYLLDKIFYYNARQKIVVFGHYTDEKGETGVKFSDRIVKAQINFSEYWNFPILKIWEKCGWNNNYVRTTGYWNNSNIWVNSGGAETNLPTYKIWMEDTLHPHSDASGEANMHIAKIAKSLLY